VVATTAATAPHLIMTYCALLALAVLRDDYALLDRAALERMVRRRRVRVRIYLSFLSL